MDKLIPAFQDSLFDPSLRDVCVDIAELGIDSLLDDGVFRSIPIAGLLLGIGETAQNVHDRNLLRQTVGFINAFHAGTISAEKKEAYRARLLGNEKFAEAELGRVLILLDSYVDVRKSALLGKFYGAYVDERIPWETFCELADVVSRVFMADIRLLFDVYGGRVEDTSQCEGYQADRLLALGLLCSSMKSLMIGCANDRRTQRFLRVSGLGGLFCELGAQEPGNGG